MKFENADGKPVEVNFQNFEKTLPEDKVGQQTQTRNRGSRSDSKPLLSPGNVKYTELAIAQARTAGVAPNPEEAANTLAIEDAETRLRRWEDSLERGLLAPEEAAKWIKEIRAELNVLLSKRASLDQRRRQSKILPIPTKLMEAYVQGMQARLKAKAVGAKKEFLRELSSRSGSAAIM